MATIQPSILTADFANLAKELKKVSSAKLLHLDIMDGHFVPNLSFGAKVCMDLSKITNQRFDIHLMLTDPINYIEQFVTPNTQTIIVHQEIDNLEETIKKIQSFHVYAGIAISPETEIDTLTEYLPHIAQVLVMSVKPGFGGQSFIENTYNKVEALYKYRQEHNCFYAITVDGGINDTNCFKLKELGADFLVMGSFLFNNKNTKKIFKKLDKELERK